MAISITVKEEGEKHLRVELAGVIDETADFFKTVSGEIRKLTIVCNKVTRTNSAGIRLLVRFLSFHRARGVVLKFQKVSPSLMELNEVIPFIGADEIESFVLPLFCKDCRKTWYPISKAAEAAAAIHKARDLPCPKCRGVMWIDVDAKYFDNISSLQFHAAA